MVVDDDSRPLPPGIEGRLYFRDPTGRGIVDEGDPQKTAEAHLEPGVFRPGEIGWIDDDRFVYITDRFSDMVVSGGVNIYPADAERVLGRHPDVADVACVGLRDPEMGERLVAIVQPRPGRSPTAGELETWCRTSLAGYKCPKELLVVDEVPRNPMGKIDKRSLRAAHAARAGSPPAT